MKQLKRANKIKEEASLLFKDGKMDECITKFEECLEIDQLNANYNSTILLNIAIA